MKSENWQQAMAIRDVLRGVLAEHALVRRGARRQLLEEALAKSLHDVLPADRPEVLSALRDQFPSDLGDTDPFGGPARMGAAEPAPAPLPPPPSASAAQPVGLVPVQRELAKFAAEMSQLMAGIWAEFGETLKPVDVLSLSEEALMGDGNALERLKRALSEMTARQIAAVAGFAKSGRDWAANWTGRLDPEVIKGRVQRGAGVFARVEPLCWQEYERLATGFNAEMADREIGDLAAKIARENYDRIRPKSGR